ncbi:MAG: beta-propeller domain-containing protein [Desulfobacterales bacterium]|nr:beta-propeller domain-containing protein [Desulfobacterales bacterium]
MIPKQTMKPMLSSLVCFLWFVLLSFSDNSFVFAADSNTNVPELKPIATCEQLLAIMKDMAIQKMEKRIDRNLANALEWGNLCYKGGIVPYLEMDTAVTNGTPPTDGNVQSPEAEAPKEYTDTNVQVAGVDEADFVKTDGENIYILGHEKFRIIDSWPPENAKEISSFKLEGTPKKMFVHQQKAFIYTALDPIPTNDEYFPYYYGRYYTDTQECTYGYDCEFTGDGRQLKITVLDISNLNKPQTLREIYFSGGFLNARRIGQAVYSVVVFPEPLIKGLEYWPDTSLFSNYCYPYVTYNYINDSDSSLNPTPPKEDIIAAFENLRQKNKERILSSDLNEWLPVIKDVNYNNGTSTVFENILNTCSNFYVPATQDGMNFISIVATDINGTSALNPTTIFGKPGAVYASDSSLYIASKQSRYDDIIWYFAPESSIDEASTIYKFDLQVSPPAADYSASGVVKGSVLNQFSMDEYQGMLRIATTNGHVPDPNTHSTVSVLEEKDSVLSMVGQVDKIAPTEDIRSVRFIGDKGYIVTFKKTDPLFVLDLSNPYLPKIAGELKIPGFSTYIHPLDKTHLISIGYDSDEQGSFAWFQGIMLQIFDVADMQNPKLIHKEVIGSRGSTSDAATDHMAFTYFPSKKLLAIPITVCEGAEGGGNYGDIMTFSGLLVYRVDIETGFEQLGGVPHIAPEDSHNYRYSCYNWWTDSNSYVKRSIFMDDYVYSITEDSIKVNSINDLEQELAIIYLNDTPLCDPFHVGACNEPIKCLSTNGTWRDERCGLLGFRSKTGTAFSCIPELANDLTIHIPQIQVDTEMGNMNLWIDLKYVPDGGRQLFEVVSIGKLQGKLNETEYNLPILTKNLVLDIPKMNYESPNGTMPLWSLFRYVRNDEQRLIFELNAYGNVD